MSFIQMLFTKTKSVSNLTNESAILHICENIIFVECRLDFDIKFVGWIFYIILFYIRAITFLDQ